jgi:hypothetical protein
MHSPSYSTTLLFLLLSFAGDYLDTPPTSESIVSGKVFAKHCPNK